ncbi:hypothetical protein DXG03_008319 [Asterophora parasitica]|uniref:Nucleoporin Nup54 alpha-helical domain-containing protein n=1 Tax=Asterophora parasitica TaxID=117018 RepID=A0A9P7G5L1_9AGAR|nr:hypothetical protein DXG03_008319 [Asterophora parasitica]
MSIFGNATVQQQPAAGGLFGNTTNQASGAGLFGGQQQPAAGGLFGQQQPATGGGLFGNTQQQPAAGGGIFGQQQPATGGGLFGGQQQQQPATGGGLFGNVQQQPAGGGLFGQPQPATGGPFGGQQQQPATGGGLFGNTQGQTNPGGGLFGSSTQQQPAATSGGLFGSTTQQPPATTGGGMFGSSTQQPASTTGGLFGSTTQQQTGGLFGPTTQPQQGGGLFGSSTQQPATGGALFGKPAGTGLNINTNTQGSSLFGSTLGQQQQQQPGATGGLFSQPSQSQAKPSLFGSTNTNSLFGAGNTSTLNASALGGQTGGLGISALTRSSAGPAQQQADAQAQHARLLQRIEAVYNAWNPSSPQCRFQHVFYNLVNPNQISLYRQPPNILNELWEKATRENPDPKRLVPVVATGFDDLRERVDAQSRQVEQQKERLKDLTTRLDALAERHSLSNTARLQRAASHQTQLTQRLLAFVQHLHLLIPAIRSSSIRPEEEQLRGQLEDIEEEVRRGRIRGKLNELWALVGAVNAASERGGNGGNGGSGQGEWAVVDEEGLAQIAQILMEQQNGLAHLTKILQTHQKDLGVIMGSGTSGVNGDETNDSIDSSWKSTSTLRASALR